MEEIKKFLYHRTFIGFTRNREKVPRITLSVLGKTEAITLGFPELKYQDEKSGTVFVNESAKATKSGTNRTLSAVMKGFYTWDEKNYGLDKNQLNTGLMLSVKGIPYFDLDMGEYGSRSLRTARPGTNKCCLIVECDQIQEEMNISRSQLVDSEATDLLKEAVAKIFDKIESSDVFLKFRRVQEARKAASGAEETDVKKKNLESENQKWVVYQESDASAPIILSREPENENDVLCILWKMEALNALPFKTFQTLGHAGTGPDLIVHFQEDEQSNPDRYASIEVENKFYNYALHGHKPSQYPRIICWEIGRTPKVPISKTDKKYKSTTIKEDFQLHIFSIRLMDKVKILTKREIEKLKSK